MSCQTIGPGQGRQGGEADLPCRPSLGTVDRIVEASRRMWRRATACKPRTPTGKTCAARSDDDDDLLDEMAIW